MLRYNSTAASDEWEDTIQALEAELLDNNTSKNIVSIIAGQLYVWQGNDIELLTSKSPSLTTAILAQQLIGWQAFIEGCLSIEWKRQA